MQRSSKGNCVPCVKVPHPKELSAQQVKRIASSTPDQLFMIAIKRGNLGRLTIVAVTFDDYHEQLSGVELAMQISNWSTLATRRG